MRSARGKLASWLALEEAEDAEELDDEEDEVSDESEDESEEVEPRRCRRPPERKENTTHLQQANATSKKSKGERRRQQKINTHKVH